jgi:L-lactate dehydrogenase complex protein LldE
MRVALFVTCLVDSFRPSVGFATLKLLEDAGCEVEVPEAQTCCGQPAYNSGDAGNARAIARQVIEAFSGYEYVIIPSGSCAGMLIKHYPQLLADDEAWRQRAEQFSSRCYELVTFLHDVLQIKTFPARPNTSITYHDSCSLLREIQASQKARALLQSTEGVEFKESPNTEVCCGFGGTFAVKFSEISTRMADDKIASIEASEAQMLLAADLGCLLHIAGRMKRCNNSTRVFHIAEFLAGMAHGPGIGEKEHQQ